MAYADQQMSGNKVTALIIVALIHVAVGYALVTGLAYSAAQEIIKKVTTVDIKEEVKKEEEPPPPEPPKDVPPPPIVAPPPPINVATVPPPVTTVITAPPPPPVLVPVAAPPPAPPAPPPPRFTPKSAAPRGNPSGWATTDDYPSRALRDEKEGVTRVRVSIGTDGRVTGCEVTGSSGTPELDTTTCTLITRRGRFTPATDGEGQPTTGVWSTSVRWQIPKD